jgi:16S rRNA (uracil1498-N3)-methyltransferase
MHLFHCPDLTTDMVQLPEEEAHHAASVLRLKVGENIGLLDGKGQRAEASIVEITKRGVLAHIHARVLHPAERVARIHLAVAPTKQMDRYEWFVEKAVEIGVDRITPLMTERTERTPAPHRSIGTRGHQRHEAEPAQLVAPDRRARPR